MPAFDRLYPPKTLLQYCYCSLIVGVLCFNLTSLPGCNREPEVELFAVSDIYSVKPDGQLQELASGNPGQLAISNQHWDLASKTIHLAGAKNEEVAVQLIIGNSGRFSTEIQPLKNGDHSISTGRITISAIAWVEHEKAGLVPDVVIPLNGQVQGLRELPVPMEVDGLSKANNSSGVLLLEVWIPADAAAGEYRSQLTLKKNGLDFQTVNLELTVFDIALPDQPSLAFELLSYGMPSKAIDRSAAINTTKGGRIEARPLAPELLAFNHQAFKLVLDHRCFINALPYSSQRGNADFALPVNGVGESAHISGFDAWEQLYEPLLDGKLSKFGSVPSHVFLPFNINYPYLSESEPQRQFDFEPFRNNVPEKPGQQLALREFEDTYLAIARQYRAYFAAKGWTTPRFEVFYNQKINPERNRSPWKLDEPVQESDYRGLRYLFELAREGFAPWREDGVQIVNRLDIGHWNCDKLHTEDNDPAKCYKKKGYNRDQADQYLKGLVDHWVIGSTHAEAATHLFDQYRQKNVKMINYSTSGSASGIGGHHAQFAGEGFRAFRMGLDGRVIFKLGLIHGDPARVSADPYRGSSIYKGQFLGYSGALPSRRLKLWRRAVNDYEYLKLAEKIDPIAVKKLLDLMVTTGESHDSKYAERSNLQGFWLNNNVEDYVRAKAILAAIISGQKVDRNLEGSSNQYIPCISGDRIGGYD